MPSNRVSEETLKRLINKILAGPEYQAQESGDERSRQYEIYNILHWINEHTADSKIAQEAFERIQKANPDFKPPEYRDLDHWTPKKATYALRESPVSADELLSKPPEEWINFLITYESEKSHYDWKREGLLSQVSKAILISFDWGIRLARSLTEIKEWKSDVWFNIFKGFEKSILSSAQWQELLQLIADHHQLQADEIRVVDLFETSIRRESGGIPGDILGEVEKVSTLLWKSFEKLPTGEGPDYGGWLATAINHSAGKLTELWIQALHKRHQAKKDDWTRIPDDYVARFTGIINSVSFSGQLGRAVLASRFHYFYYLDADWTVQNLLPLFDFAADKLRAEQAWHGMLYWGKVPTNLLINFKPLFKQAVAQLKQDNEKIRERLFAYILDQVLVDPGDPLADGWFYEILNSRYTTNDDREFMATRVWHRLREESDQYKGSAWERWLRRYWSDRAKNVPLAFSVKEANRFIEWTPHLTTVFSEAVNLACQTERFNLEQTLLYRDLIDKKLVESEPQAVLKLLVYVLDDGKESSLHCDTLAPLYRALSEQLSKDEIKPLLEHLMRIGCMLY